MDAIIRLLFEYPGTISLAVLGLAVVYTAYLQWRSSPACPKCRSTKVDILESGIFIKTLYGCQTCQRTWQKGEYKT